MRLIKFPLNHSKQKSLYLASFGAVLGMAVVLSMLFLSNTAQAGGAVGGGGSGGGGGGGGGHTPQTSYGWGWAVYDTSGPGPTHGFINKTSWAAVQATCQSASAKSIYANIVMDSFGDGTVYDYKSSWAAYAGHFVAGTSVDHGKATAIDTVTAENAFNDLPTYGVDTTGYTFGSNVGWFCYDIAPPPCPSGGCGGGTQAPVGTLDVANCSTIEGWAYDPDDPAASIQVHIYIGGGAGSGIVPYPVNANLPRPDLNASPPSGLGIPGDHGFVFSTPPGASGDVYVYAIDIQGKSNTQLNVAGFPGPGFINIGACPTQAPTPEVDAGPYCDAATGFGVASVTWPAGTLPGTAGIYIDVSTDPGFGTFYKHGPLPGTSDTIPNGYVDNVSGAAMPPLLGGTTYFVRLYSDAYNLVHSKTASFVAPVCPTTAPSATPECYGSVSGARLSWFGSPDAIGPGGAVGFYVELSTSSGFGSYYTKWVGVAPTTSQYSTPAPSGFVLNGAGTPMPSMGAGTWHARVNNGKYSGTTSFTTSECEAPYIRVYGGDVRAGDSFRDSSSGACIPVPLVPGADIKAYNDSANGYAGSGSQFAVFATGNITEFVSSAMNVPPAIAPVPKGLTFANTSGAYDGNFGSNECLPDFMANAQEVPPASIRGPGLIDIGAMEACPSPPTPMEAKIYVNSPGLTTIKGKPCDIKNRTRITIYADGDVVIKDYNITFSGGYNAPRDIPAMYVVAKGNIYIDKSITRLDGMYVSQAGTIYTCSNGPAIPGGNWLVTNCGTQLVVNGSLMAPTIKLLRLANSVSNASAAETAYANNAAETINFTPEFWMTRFPLWGSDAGGSSAAYDIITNLPPVL